MAAVRYVCESDRAFWFGLDRHLSEAEFDRKVRDRRGYVLTEGERAVGLLRYNLFWDELPFCTLLFVAEEHRGNGYGTMLMEAWERDMRAKGYGLLMTSTQADETAQHFYRKIGYRDSGGLILDVPGYEQPMEMFLVKRIG